MEQKKTWQERKAKGEGKNERRVWKEERRRVFIGKLRKRNEQKEKDTKGN